MRRVGLGLVAVLAVTAAVACSSNGGGGSTSSPTPTPIPTGPAYNYSINGTGFGGLNGAMVGVRIYAGANVALCSTAGTVTGNHFTLTLATALVSGVAYHGEVFVDQNANSTYETGDLTYYDPSTNTAGTFTVTTSRTWSIVRTTSQSISWPSGTMCP